jgi:hypothetical protein
MAKCNWQPGDGPIGVLPGRQLKGLSRASVSLSA